MHKNCLTLQIPLKISRLQEMIRDETNLCSNVLLRKLLPHEQIVLQCNEKESTIFIRLTEAPTVVEPEC